ncbi:MAG: hypothetical protein LKI39_02940 [Bacteroides sp.]|jgi:hypothetical protein|nr:hypothetical protein [Bacteroides sp.]
MKTKRIKFLAVAVILLIGISFTSCLNSDNNTTSPIRGFVKVYNSYSTYFKDLTGAIYTPTTTSLATWETYGFKPESTNIAYIYGTYDTEQYPNAVTDKNYPIDLSFAISLDHKVEIVDNSGASNDSINKAAIISLDASSQYSNSAILKPWFFDEKTLMLPIQYYLSKDNHSFTLVYYPSENQVANGTLKLHLRHNNQGDTSTSSNSLNEYIKNSMYVYIYLCAYDLSDVLDLYGGNVSNIEIETKENPSSVALDDSQTTTNTYTVEHKVIDISE